VAVTIGQGGVAGANDTAGTDGDNTTFGSLLTAYGGAGGRVGNDNANAPTSYGGGLLGQTATGDQYYTGGKGNIGAGSAAFMGGGGGGGSSMVSGATLGGTSVGGGAGGGGVRVGTAGAGMAPGGGGGAAANSGTIGGAGARGELRIMVVG